MSARLSSTVGRPWGYLSRSAPHHPPTAIRRRQLMEVCLFRAPGQSHGDYRQSPLMLIGRLVILSTRLKPGGYAVSARTAKTSARANHWSDHSSGTKACLQAGSCGFLRLADNARSICRRLGRPHCRSTAGVYRLPARRLIYVRGVTRKPQRERADSIPAVGSYLVASLCTGINRRLNQSFHGH